MHCGYSTGQEVHRFFYALTNPSSQFSQRFMYATARTLVTLFLGILVYFSLHWCSSISVFATAFVFSLQANLAYQDHLLQQVDYLQTTRQLEKEQIRREIAMCKEAEKVYKQRVQDALARPNPDKIHPKRLLVTGQQIS